MVKETADKSVVVWYPNLMTPVPDAREWTSLCLFHDQVMLCKFQALVYENQYLRNLIASGGWDNSEWHISKWPESDWKARLTFNNILEVLAKESVVQIICSGPGKDTFPLVRDKLILGDKFIAHPVRRLLRRIDKERRYLDTADPIMAYGISRAYHYPVASEEEAFLKDTNTAKSPHILSRLLARSAICQLALPDVRAIHAEDLLDARTELRDELLEFRAGILKLSWLLHQQVQDKTDLEEIRHEANTLVNTVIKGSLLSLENRMRQHKKKTIRRMLFGTGRVVVEATKLFLPSGAAEIMISGGKSFLQLATEIDSVKLPEDQVATYLYKLRGKLKP